MISKPILIFSILIFLYGVGFTQTKNIRIKDENLKNTYEDISFLKSNIKIKDGCYRKTICGKTSIEGNYKNDVRIGVWKVYDYFGKVEIEIDYNSGELKYRTFDSISKTNIYVNSAIIPSGDRPLLSLSSYNIVSYYLMHFIIYPQSATEKNVSGKVIISVKVDANGKITDYVPYKSIDKSLDYESIRVIKLMPIEFLPEYKNGKPVASDYKIPVEFRLQQ